MSTETHVVRGVAFWAKIIGAPRLNKFTGEKEWSIDVTPDKEGLALLKKLGLADRLRDPKDGDVREERFLSFRHNELKADGTKADPIRIVNANNEPWSGDLIGNGSDIDAKFVVKDYGPGRKKGMYLRAIRVLNLVPFVAKDFAPLSSDDEFFAETPEDTVPEDLKLPTGMEPSTADDDLNDDVPM